MNTQARLQALSDVQAKLQSLFEDLQKAPIIWQDQGSKEAWLDEQIRIHGERAAQNVVSDPLVALHLYAQVIGMLILAISEAG